MSNKVVSGISLEDFRKHQEVVKTLSFEYGCKYLNLTSFLSWYNLGFFTDHIIINMMFEEAQKGVLAYDKMNYTKFENHFGIWQRLSYKLYCELKGIEE